MEVMMIESIFALLQKVGFTHPLHPMLVHVPMGMIIGMFVFSLLGLKWTKGPLPQTAYHCSVLALASVVPVILAGVMDWQHSLNGDWKTLIIIKMVLSFILTLLLVYAVVVRNRGASPKHLFAVYCLCMVCAAGLGYSGGELVYGG
jgi:uncharacterized membrane protein